jgi:hypothetical protein
MSGNVCDFAFVIRMRQRRDAPAGRPVRAIFGSVVAIAMFFGAGADVLAKERRTVAEGLAACRQWCEAHNRTLPSRSQCIANCEKYWACNGSDSTANTCRLVLEALPGKSPPVGPAPRPGGAVATKPGLAVGPATPPNR